jgi:class 3 adenylate cyclase
MQIRVMQPAADSRALFSERMVQYVVRTGSRLIIEDARTDNRFLSCPYVSAFAPRSVVCLPLLKKNEIFGAVYIENRMASGTCTESRLPPLMVLSQQVATVIENSRLHHLLNDNISSLKSAMHNVELLERIQRHLTKFVPQSLQKLIETNPDNPDLATRNEDISILFLDMAGYTSMSEQLDSEELKTLVEKYFSGFIDDIHRNHGDISEIAGDGLMLVFQHPEPAEHARLATRTALAIREKTSRLNAEGQGQWPAVVINIGIHSGEALMGANKIESGIGTRWIYTATGYAANLAARIGASATNGAILISDATAARLGDEFELRATGAQTFKGISRPIEVFRVIGAK